MTKINCYKLLNQRLTLLQKLKLYNINANINSSQIDLYFEYLRIYFVPNSVTAMQSIYAILTLMHIICLGKHS